MLSLVMQLSQWLVGHLIVTSSTFSLSQKPLVSFQEELSTYFPRIRVTILDRYVWIELGRDLITSDYWKKSCSA